MRGVATDDSQASIGKWPDTILRNLDLDFLDDPFPATGKSNVEQFFNEWYQDNKEFKDYRNFQECLAYKGLHDKEWTF